MTTSASLITPLRYGNSRAFKGGPMTSASSHTVRAWMQVPSTDSPRARAKSSHYAMEISGGWPKMGNSRSGQNSINYKTHRVASAIVSSFPHRLEKARPKNSLVGRRQTLINASVDSFRYARKLHRREKHVSTRVGFWNTPNRAIRPFLPYRHRGFIREGNFALHILRTIRNRLLGWRGVAKPVR